MVHQTPAHVQEYEKRDITDFQEGCFRVVESPKAMGVGCLQSHRSRAECRLQSVSVILVRKEILAIGLTQMVVL